MIRRSLLRVVNRLARRHMLKIERVDDQLARASRPEPWYLCGSDE